MSEKPERDHLYALETVVQYGGWEGCPSQNFRDLVAVLRQHQDTIAELRADVKALQARDDEPVNMTEVLEKIY